MSRRRLDTLLAERGLAGSRTSAAASVRAGLVRLGRGGRRAEKPSQLVAEDAELVVEERPRYASRGGAKLENAIRALGVEVEGRACLDVGASTGGFTDCLLQHGAERVVALDVGYGQLDWRLRQDARVDVLERTNVRHLRPEELPFAPELATVDVSFISLAKVLPAVARCLAPGGEVLALVKPQFELGPERVGKGGVVREAAARRAALVSVAGAARGIGLHLRDFASSELPGPKGNRETFILCSLEGPGIEDVEEAAREVEP
jgi:23S rRNA (cytidine1920-2'-O)/16S rRNA (cytidine1409-2'-O)-methyltransferase